jgi:hypothetical protein
LFSLREGCLMKILHKPLLEAMYYYAEDFGTILLLYIYYRAYSIYNTTNHRLVESTNKVCKPLQSKIVECF